MTPRLRPAVADDIDALAALNMAVWKAAYPGIVPQGFLDRLDIGRFLADWAFMLAEPGVLALVAVDEGGAVRGFIACGPPKPEVPGYAWEVYRIYVDPAAQRLGLGRALMGAAGRAMRDRGGQGAILWVFEANQAARRFYGRLGGREVRKQTFHIFDGMEMVEVAYGWPDLRVLAALD
ncbi:GNAT family N-acetyltransferase [Aerophototrophica crusticola]|uniref:GNAT family N-acetyltransferase n=1 Tax=Aerophototrophica crusticola TaxID=1709002 RepID=A0A858R6K9_9PROT|nr:GNAT family N-acetyltransferase [Rhodospirillaceae bacterium B3]